MKAPLPSRYYPCESCYIPVHTTNGTLLVAAKRYTFTIKDELLPKDPDSGREQSTISYEYDFVVGEKESERHRDGTKIFIPWSELKATYRGKEKKEAPKLDLKAIRRFSLLMRRCVERILPTKLYAFSSHHLSALFSAKGSIW